jgi:hypothetical protein
MTPSQKKYLEEYEKFKHIQINEGKEYSVVSKPTTTYIVVTVDYTNERVSLKNRSGIILSKTLHWCRKNLTELWGQGS